MLNVSAGGLGALCSIRVTQALYGKSGLYSRN